METTTNEENVEQYIALKAKLLNEYKSYAQELEYADNTFDEGHYMKKREKLAINIKNLGEKIRQFEV